VYQLTTPGGYFVFDSLDGSGATSATRMLVSRLNGAGIKAILVKEPDDELEPGNVIRQVLRGTQYLHPAGLQLAFATVRGRLMDQVIIPALKQGTNVVGDRSLVSSLWFGSLELDLGWLAVVNQYFPEPDVVFNILVPVSETQRRMAATRSSLELFEAVDVQGRLTTTYEKVAKMLRHPPVLLDGALSTEELVELAFERIRSFKRGTR
jgi:dTMP kinase